MPEHEITTFAYGGTVPDGYLASITSPPFNGNSAVTTFAYDSFNRVRTVTDSDGYAVTTDYDNLDRKTKITYPDATFEQFQYTDNVTGAMTLDLTGSRDRRGLWTYRHYNANRQMDSITDPANRTTQYGWCNCGALESITDPKAQVTTFNRDIQSRVYQKVFNDGTTINYLYEGQTAPNTAGATSRLQSSTDAKNQRTNYTYFADDNLAQISLHRHKRAAAQSAHAIGQLHLRSELQSGPHDGGWQRDDRLWLQSGDHAARFGRESPRQHRRRRCRTTPSRSATTSWAG